MRHVFIVNPVSGKADASGLLVPRIIQAAAQQHLNYQILLTEKPGHGVELAQRQAQQEGQVRLYACGGDGTLNEVLRGAYGHANAQVACVPCGSGNDFVRNFGGSAPFLNLEDLIQGEAVPMDLIETDQGIAVAICSAGLDAQVAYGIPKFRRIPLCGGSMAYKLSILQAVSGPLGHRLRICADDEIITGDFLMLALCNGSTYGGGFLAAPHACMNDGFLELILVRKIGRLQIARLIGDYQKGLHMQGDQVAPAYRDIILARKVRRLQLDTLDGRPIVVTRDGECAPYSSLRAHVLPAAAQIVLPRSVLDTELSALCKDAAFNR